MITAEKQTVTVLSVSLADILDAPNAVGLIQAYAEECLVPGAKPQRDTYAAMEKAGALKCFGAYVGDSLIGFCSILIARMPHTGSLQAAGESIFVESLHRGTGAGNLLIDAAERYADSIHALLSWLPRSGSQLDTVLSHRPGYALTHSQHTRRLL